MTDYRDNFEVAFRHLEAHRYALALETFNKINDDDPALIWWRSICYFALGEFENALTDSEVLLEHCLLYTSPSPRDQRGSRMPSSA